MNCQDLNSVLDTCAPGEVSAGQKRDIERHFASCEECREAWAAYREIVTQPIPDTPRDLERRIATALDEQEASDGGPSSPAARSSSALRWRRPSHSAWRSGSEYVPAHDRRR